MFPSLNTVHIAENNNKKNIQSWNRWAVSWLWKILMKFTYHSRPVARCPLYPPLSVHQTDPAQCGANVHWPWKWAGFELQLQNWPWQKRHYLVAKEKQNFKWVYFSWLNIEKNYQGWTKVVFVPFTLEKISGCFYFFLNNITDFLQFVFNLFYYPRLHRIVQNIYNDSELCR